MKQMTSYMNITLLFCAALFLFGCAGSTPSVKVMDSGGNNPYYLCQNADKHLLNNEIDQAQELYKRALGIEKNYSPGYVGLSKIAVMTGQDNAIEYAQKAMDSARKKDEKLSASTQLMNVYYQTRPDGWFDSMKTLWAAIKNDHEKPEEAALVMGKANLTNEKYLDATVFFRQVLDWDGHFTSQADALLNGIYQQLRAEPGTKAAKMIARQKLVTRADLSVLLVEELKLIDYINIHAGQSEQAGFQTPQVFKTSVQEISYPVDIQGHPYEKDIKLILAYGLEGLKPFSDQTFSPQEPVTRAGFSMIVEDVLSRLNNDPGLKKAYVGSNSPFADVPSGNYALNAIIVCSTRNFLAADLDGSFRPTDAVSGTETLLTIRRLKQEIKSKQVKY
ncbi:MAG: S-layer homology domain-containing protein [Pseudomonadota bacterium]